MLGQYEIHELLNEAIMTFFKGRPYTRVLSRSPYKWVILSIYIYIYIYIYIQYYILLNVARDYLIMTEAIQQLLKHPWQFLTYRLTTQNSYSHGSFCLILFLWCFCISRNTRTHMETPTERSRHDFRSVWTASTYIMFLLGICLVMS